jgi:hypothetical protein
VEITFQKDVIAALKKAGCKSPILSDRDAGYRGIEIDTRALVKTDIPIMMRVLKEGPFFQKTENRRAYRQLEAIEAIESGEAKDKKITNLESLPDILRAVIAPTKHKWLFMGDSSFGIPLPWMVTFIRYYPPVKERDSYTPAKVQMSMEAMARGHELSHTITFYRADLKLTALELIDKHGCLLESQKLVADYERSLEKHRAHADKTGHQYIGKGFAREGTSSWSRSTVALEKDGVPAKCVMDDDGYEKDSEQPGTDSGYTHSKFWAKNYHGDEDEEGEEAHKLPVHPIVRFFNLSNHEFETTHIDNLEPYPYDEKIGEKLVLPDDHRELIDALTGHAIEKMEDIVQGKATGVILLCSGKPGTGKTLTAEVYSEVAKRPLYAVQCSQLGTNEEELEEKLTTVLNRATRWGAILLIDEADVYIYERGTDIGQNAIVGVFLRLLEYYGGILFLTTNRDTIIDDAILSRVTAHVRYDVPVDEKAVETWRVLLQQYDTTTLSPKDCAKAFPGISGRSVRQLIKLARIMAAKRKAQVTVELLKWAAKFQDFTEKDQETGQ